MSELSWFLTALPEDVMRQRSEIIPLCCSACGTSDPHGLLEEIASRTLVITLLAGSGSRWVRSVQSAHAQGIPIDFDLSKPRGLFPVSNLFGESPGVKGRFDAVPESPRVPVALYSLFAVRGLGEHVIMTSGFEEEIESEILVPLCFPGKARELVRQKTHGGSPLGHGDAAWQLTARFPRYDYVLVNFGGDANSRLTVIQSLFLMHALNNVNSAPDVLLPSAWVDKPQYLIERDASGHPRRFLHNKLQGAAREVPSGLSNVGLRLYRSGALADGVNFFHDTYYRDDSGYAVPGNAANEFALDNVDAAFALEGRAAVLAIARAGEITPAKTWDDIPAFLSAVGRILEEDSHEPLVTTSPWERG